ncbi:MAG: 2-oxoacid:acceptor oxidoreductase family protein [Candidatus Omnitrophica bacterium]|nr:2-oxoacid:acceptor oxidoreductase family protein [Candidatus Omnitrophota bacterium]
MIDERILISGFGGQGIMLLGKLLCRAAVNEGKHATYIPSYGAEMRGGTAHCLVRIKDAPIASPIFRQCSLLVALNEPSWIKFFDRVLPEGFALTNRSLFSVEKQCSLNLVQAPLSDMASSLGTLKVINAVSLGVLLAKKEVVNPKTVRQVFKDLFSSRGDVLTLNLKAFDLGGQYGKD